MKLNWNKEKIAQKLKLGEKLKGKGKVLILCVLAIALVGGIAAWTALKKPEAGQETPVMSASAEKGTLTTTIESSGTLAGKDETVVEIPTGVKIKKVKVSLGDEVKKGAVLATVDSLSISSLLAQTQEELSQVNGEINEESDHDSVQYVESDVDGRVKKIYARKNTAVSDTILSKGALMLLSLDGKMAVDLDTEITVKAGQEVEVNAANGTFTGTVAEASEGSCTVTVTDNGTKYNEKVTVTTAAGKTVGSGRLYIEKEAKVMATSGTVKKILVSENESVSQGDSLLKLSGDFQTAEYLALAEEQEQLEEKLEILLDISKKNGITAKTDGIITAVNVSDDSESGSGSGTSSTAASSNTMSSLEKGRDAASLKTGENQAVSLKAGGSGSASPGTSGVIPLSSTAAGEDASTASVASESTTASEESGSTTASDESESTTASEESGSTTASDESESTTASEESESTTATKESGSTAAAKESQQGGATATEGSQQMGGSGSGGSGASGAGVSQGASSGSDSSDSSSSSQNSSDSSDTKEEFTEAFRVASGDDMLLTVNVDEMDILSVSQGQKAEITLDAMEDQEFEGEITSIDKNGSSNGGVTKYEVEITVPREESMLSGMNASVSIVISETEEALLIPALAVTEEGNRSYVYTKEDENTGELSEKTQVITGETDGQQIQILDGLNEGDTVYYQMAASQSSDEGDSEEKEQNGGMFQRDGMERQGGGGGTPPSGGNGNQPQMPSGGGRQ